MQNFGRENFDNSKFICQIGQTFPPSKFCTILYTNTNQFKLTINSHYSVSV